MRKLLIFLVVITSCLSVTISEFSIIHTGCLLLVMLYSLMMFPGFDLEFDVTNYFFRLLLPFSIALFISLPINYLLYHDFPYYKINPVGRILNLFGITLIMLNINTALKANLQFNTLLKWYFFSASLIVISAIWHSLDLYLGFPIKFPFETRSLVHSGGNNLTIGSRLTGIAQEPSYLASILIDFWVFSLILFKNKLVLLRILRIACLILVFLTFSPSAYISLLIMILVEWYLILKSKGRVGVLLVIPFVLAVFPFLMLIFRNSNLESINYFSKRLDTFSDSGRFEIIYKSVISIWDSGDIFKILFGNGLKAFELFSYKFPEISIETSNNLFVDVFFEGGLVAVTCLIYFLIRVFNYIKRIDKIEYLTFASLLYFNLIVSSFYRADYATFRFFFILFVIFVFINHKKYLFSK